MKTEIRIFKIIGKQSPNEIISNNELGSIGGSAVESYKIYEIQLMEINGCAYVSLLTNKKTFDKLKGEKNVIVESKGFWNSLTDSNVKVFAEKSKAQLIGTKIF